MSNLRYVCNFARIIIGAVIAEGAATAILAMRGSGKASAVSSSIAPVVIGNP